MSLLSIFKLFFLVIWPSLLLIPYYFYDKEQFKRRVKEIFKKSQ